MARMQQRLRRCGLLCLGVLGLLLAPGADAQPVADSIDFALQLSRLDTALHDGPRDIDTTVKHLGIVSFDLTQPLLQPGLAVGYAYISPANQTATAGMELEGFYLAPALRGVLLDGRRLRATLTAAYLYQRVRDSNSTQAVTLEWQQPQVDLEVKCRLGRQIVVVAAGSYGRIDADESLSGIVNQTLTLHSGPTLGYRAGLEYDLGDPGQVGILLHRALGDGVEIYFQRQF